MSNMTLPPVVIAIHGVLTRTMRASWADEFRAWVVRERYCAEVLPSQYFALPLLPMVEVWGWNWVRAQQVLGDLDPFLAGSPRVHIVAHSNGADIALRIARELWARHYTISSLVLTCAAAEPDVRKSAVLYAAQSGLLHRAVAICATDDWVIRHGPIWPYGRLGATGWQLAGKEFAQCPDGEDLGTICTHRVPGGHAEMFGEPRREATFRLFAELLHLRKMPDEQEVIA